MYVEISKETTAVALRELNFLIYRTEDEDSDSLQDDVFQVWVELRDVLGEISG